jgi:hypothetical protein
MNSVAQPNIDVTFFHTTIDGKVYNHGVTFGLLIDSEGNDVSALENLPLVGTKIKTLGFTLDQGETVYYETITNANVRPLPVGLQKFAFQMIRFIKFVSGVFTFWVDAKNAFKDEKDPIRVAIKEFNKTAIDNNIILQSMDDVDEKEMFNSLGILGKIIINGRAYLLLRINFQGHSVLFFDISKPLDL